MSIACHGTSNQPCWLATSCQFSPSPCFCHLHPLLLAICTMTCITICDMVCNMMYIILCSTPCSTVCITVCCIVCIHRALQCASLCTLHVASGVHEQKYWLHWLVFCTLLTKLQKSLKVLQSTGLIHSRKDGDSDLNILIQCQANMACY